MRKIVKLVQVQPKASRYNSKTCFNSQMCENINNWKGKEKRRKLC